MERLNNITKEELNKLYDLCKLNSLIREDLEFEKWLLDFERNIALGNNFNGYILGKHYISDDKVLILEESKCLIINPLPFEKEKQKMSDVYKKVLLLISNSKIEKIIIKDMIIDNTSIFDNLKAYKVYFKNCYFTDNLVLNFNYVKTLELLYCNLSDFNIFSNTNVLELIINRSKFRQDSNKFNKILAREIHINSTNLNYKYLFYTSSFEYLENLQISGKVFNDSDIIMLDCVAPILKKARLNIVLKDLNTFEKINPLVYFTYPFELQERMFKTDYSFATNSNITYKLLNEDERKRIIESLELSIDSVYKNKEYKNFNPRIILHQELNIYIEQYKLDNNKDNLINNIMLSLSKLENNILKENMDQDVKKLILIEIKNIKSNTEKLERDLMSSSFDSVIHSDLGVIFKHLYSNLDDMKFYAQKENYTSVSKDKKVSNPIYIDASIERMKEVLNNYKNKRKKNFDFFEVLSITEINLSFMHIFKNRINFNFYQNFTLDRKQLSLANKTVLNETLSGDKILDKINIEDNVNDLGIVLPFGNDVFEDQRGTLDCNEIIKRNKKFRFEIAMKELIEKQVPDTNHEIMVSRCNLDKYSEVKENLNKYKKSNRLNKFIEIYGNNNEYNIDDYKLYLENHRRCTENLAFTKICLNILYNNKEKLFELTKKDYENIKQIINDKYTYRHHNIELLYYYEIINYVTKSYPDFLIRYIETYEFEEKEKTDRIFLLDYSYDFRKKEMKEMLIEEFNKSRIDTEDKSKILILNNQDNQKLYF